VGRGVSGEGVRVSKWKNPPMDALEHLAGKKER
jgi:hypothetical protein